MLSPRMRCLLTFQALFLYGVLVSFRPSASQRAQKNFNIAKGAQITATATCGYDLPKDQNTELFCKLATVPGKYGIQGLECDYCNSRLTTGSVEDTKDHHINYAIDGTERWWQSPPLSRGQQYNEINITIDLGQAFHVVYVVIKTANSPRPGMWVLEKSSDNGATYSPWYYFAPSRSDCYDYFKINPRIPLEKDDQVLCSSEYSEIPPFENGEMHIRLVNGRPSAIKNQVSPKLQEWMRATHVRLRLLKVKTLYGEFLPLAENDATVTRRFFYSIKDISIGGRCICNDYADNCVHGPSRDRVLACQCQENTCGPSCSQCCPGFHQYKWKSGYGDGTGCERCNCFEHATECYYNELVDRANRSYNLAGELRGGGVCINCQDNTIGNNCQYCKHKFYNPTGVPMTSKNACVPCNCNEKFSTGRCSNGDGQCQCKPNYSGKKCDQCSVGFYGFPDCTACQCHAEGTKDGQCKANGDQCPCKENYSGAKCDRCARGYYRFPYCAKCNCDTQGSYFNGCLATTGQCPCLPNFKGRICNQCADGYYGYPECRSCSCDARGGVDEICRKGSGECICKAGFTGSACSECAIGYYYFPQCQACQCSGQGSVSPSCDSRGQCTCKEYFAGIKCDRCTAGRYDYPRCIACECDTQGSYSDYCNPGTGQCRCRENFSGTFCNRCKPGFYGFPNCQECSCNPAGVRPLPGRPLGDCSSSNVGQCECKRWVEGQDCGKCKPKSFNLAAINPRGCDQCLCNIKGVIGGIELCDQVTGHCLCKPRVTSRRCEICKDGYYALKQSNALGCSGCACDVGGSYNQNCGKYTGQCNCRRNVGGRACDRPMTDHYHPTLYQILSEIEDGRTPENTSVRFRFDEKEFPGYSWRGYGVFSDIQPTVIARLNAKWPENYHMLFHYALDDTEAATGQVVVRHAGGGKAVTQQSSVTFKPTVNGSAVTGQFALVAERGSATQFAMLNGLYDIEFTTKSKKLLLDYVTIVPVFYPGPREVKDEPEKKGERILEDIVTRPCEVNGRAKVDDLCVQYSYISTNKPGFMKIQAEDGYSYHRERGEGRTQVLLDKDILKELDFSALALLNKKQNRLHVKNVKVPKSGKYVIMVQFFTTHANTQLLDLYVQSPNDRNFARFRTSSCKYTFGCRTVGLSLDGGVRVFDLKADVPYRLTAITGTRGSLALDSFIFVPYEQWSTDYIVPSKLCVTRMKVCTRTSYRMPADAVMVDAGVNGDQQNTNKPPNIFDPNTVLVYLQGETKFEKSVSLPKPGDYAIVVHYYQPHHSTIDSDTTVRSFRSERGKTSFKYCPNTSGCRTVVQRAGGGELFSLDDKASIGLKIPADKDLWIDYVLFVPKASYSPLLFSGEPVERANDFIQYCSKDNFHVTKDGLTFCTNSVFSLTTFYNNGSFPCSCDKRGSRSDTCEAFGGQCPCHDNVIGRNCTRCKSGYYGFPNCRKCSCDFCDPETGLCDCPPNTIGDDCTCVRGTFGYDPVIGCQPCACDATGIITAVGECNIVSGQCACHPTRTGRRCDQCKVGYYGYPNCRRCDCDPNGITGCDSTTGRCVCKPNVAGVRCDQCKVGYFYLSDEDPNGCLECWCSGQTNKCFVSNTAVANAGVIYGNWTVKDALAEVSYDRTSDKVTASFPKKNVTSPLYWALDLGDKTNAYGRSVSFSLTYSSDSTEVPLAIIESNGKLIAYKEKRSLINTVQRKVEILLAESYWRNRDGSAINRKDFMRALVQLDQFQLLASDLDVERKISFDLPVLSQLTTSQVEECICPDNTTGLSCQDCRAGYFKSGDLCVKCQCNGHSTNCDPITGECKDCQHYTTGFKCDECISGFYGDPTTGRDDACQPCPCPDGSAGKNFATSCFRRADGSFNCTCQTGFTGERCDKCADGYFGDPLTVGCKPCECNNNIDLNAEGNCDPQTGVCYRCVNNTGGDHCEDCQTGYYGDGRLNNCKRCECDACGSASTICESRTGDCTCKSGVTGTRCTSCGAGTWDFNSCNGCKQCACSKASLRDTCDPNTGQCSCQIGVIGLKCDKCDAGYFNFTADGCQACNCPPGKLCDINNGRCCDPGDSSCTVCPPYHILTAAGCEYCGPCVERLFQRVDNMLANYSTGGAGSATDQSRGRLKNVELKLGNLEDQVERYNVSIGELSTRVDGKDEEEIVGSGIRKIEKTDSLSSNVDKLSGGSMQVLETAIGVLGRAVTTKSTAVLTKDDAVNVESILYRLLNDSTELKFDAKQILKSVRGGVSNVTNVYQETLNILLIIQKRNFSELRKLAEKEYGLAGDALVDSKERLNSTTRSHNVLLTFKPQLLDMEATFNNQIDKSQASLENSLEGGKWNSIAKKYMPEAIIEKAKAKKKVADDRLVEARSILQEAKDILSKITFQNASVNSSVINQYLVKIDQRAEDRSKLNEELRILVNNATNHANQLKNLSDFLQSLLRDPLKHADAVKKAVKAYKAVVDLINEILGIAREADQNGGIALQLSTGLGLESSIARNTSESLINDATIDSKQIPVLEDWLKQLEELLKTIRANFNKARETLTEVIKPFPKFDDLTKTLGGRTKVVENKAIMSIDYSSDAKNIVDKMKLPSFEVLEQGYDNITELLTLTENVADQNKKSVSNLELKVDDIFRDQRLTEEIIETEVVDRIKRIRYNLERARENIRNNPSSAGQYNAETSVELRMPETAFGAAMKTRVEFEFKTQQSDALVLFIGSSTEYLAFEVVNGYLQVVFVKDGRNTTLNNNQLKVKTGKDEWNKVTFNRIATSTQVTLEGVNEFEGRLHSSTFTFVSPESVLFVGAPPGDFKLPGGLQTTTLHGSFAYLYINGEKVGLYDTESYTVVPKQIKNPDRDDKVIRELYFTGNGHFLSGGFQPFRETSVTIKTAANDGIIMFVTLKTTKGPLNLLLEMVNGTIGFRYNVTKYGSLSGYTKKVYNDNKEHTIVLSSIVESIISVTVDQDGDDKIGVEGQDMEINTPVIFLGGINRELGFHKIIKTPGFLGCLSNVKSGSDVDLLRFKRDWDRLNVIFDCDALQASVASFSGTDASLQVDGPQFNLDDTQMGISMKTEAKDGILMNIETKDGSIFTMGMEDGVPKFEFIIDGEVFESKPVDTRRRRRDTGGGKINDGKWHSVEVRMKDGLIQILVDGKVVASRKIKKRPRTTSGKAVMSFGGIKNPNPKSSLGKLPSLKGDIKDPVIIKANVASAINFNDATSKTGVSLGGRDVPKEITVIEVTPTTPAVEVSSTTNSGTVGSGTGMPTSEISVSTKAPTTEPTTIATTQPTTKQTTTREPTTTPATTTQKPTTMQTTVEEPTTQTTTEEPTTMTTTKKPTTQTTTEEPTTMTTTKKPTTQTTTEEPTTMTTTKKPTTQTTTEEPTTMTTTKKPTTQTTTEEATTMTTTKKPTTQTTTEEATTVQTTTEEATTTQSTTEEVTTTQSTTEEPTTTQSTTMEPTTPTTTREPTLQPTTKKPTTQTTTAEPTTAEPGGCSSPRLEYGDAMAFKGHGYAEYRIASDVKDFEYTSGVSFEFRTFAKHGILFNAEQKVKKGKYGDFFSCYLRDGKVYFGFNTGSGRLFLVTTVSYNDGKWHKVSVYRHKITANMNVSDEHAKGISKTGATAINGIKYLYVGGHPTKAKNAPDDVRNSSACIRRLKWHNNKDFSNPTKVVNEQKCYKGSIEKSAFFSRPGDYMIAYHKFNIGRKKIFTLEIKPRTLTGIIFVVADMLKNKLGDYLIMEMRDGAIVARVQNGGGPVEVVWTPAAGQTLCDNKWHPITLVKSGNSLSLKVDGTAPIKKTGKGSQSLANVNDPLFIGGVPENFKSIAVKNRSSFRGCIRNMKLKSQTVPLSNPRKIVGDVSIYGCPKFRKK